MYVGGSPEEGLAYDEMRALRWNIEVVDGVRQLPDYTLGPSSWTIVVQIL